MLSAAVLVVLVVGVMRYARRDAIRPAADVQES